MSISLGFLSKPNLLLGVILICLGLLGFLAYWWDWSFIQALYEMRIVLIPIGLAVMVYQFMNPMYVFILVVVFAGILWWFT